MTSIVLTVYLTRRIDPQRQIQWRADCDDVVQTWIGSVLRFGLQGIIFHDGLSPAFVERWSSQYVRFMPVTWQTPWTAAEERVRVYLDWLAVFHSDWVLTTDLADVEFYRDPFEVVSHPAFVY